MKTRILVAALLALTPALNAAVIENFENYAVGSNLHGQGDWSGWDNQAAAGALVSNARAFSGTKSVNMTGASDLVRTFSGITNGVWTLRLKQYVPSSSTGTNYVILLNQYRDGPSTNIYKWSVAIHNQLNNGRVVSVFGGGSTALIKDAWAEYRFDIDLNIGVVYEYYNNAALGSYVWQDGTGANALRALDLFANGADPVYYDDVVLAPAPLTGQDLQLRATIRLFEDLGISPNSMFNPRYFEGKIYANQINAGAMSFGRYASGSPVPEMLVNNTTGPEHRMVAAFIGDYRSKYLLGSSSGAAGTTTMSRYDFNGSNRVDATTPFNLTVEGFDWVDTNTVIGTVYSSGNRTRLYLFDVVGDPFSLSLNTAWNANGYIITSVSIRIRNVRTGDVYSGYAYYGDAGQNNSPNFYAVNLATGAETLLGNAGPLTGSGSFGVWTVLERGGLLYVQTTDNGIQVYRMTSATTLGPPYALYSKEEIDAVTSYSGQYYGLDVSPDTKTFILGAGGGVLFEFGPPQVNISMSGTDLTLSWPAVVSGMVIQAAPTVTSAFGDMDPQPASWVDGNLTKAIVPRAAGQQFFRLRKGP